MKDIFVAVTIIFFICTMWVMETYIEEQSVMALSRHKVEIDSQETARNSMLIKALKGQYNDK